MELWSDGKEKWDDYSADGNLYNDIDDFLISETPPSLSQILQDSSIAQDLTFDHNANGKKRQDTADNIKVGASMLPQKCSKVGNIRLNSPPMFSQSNHTQEKETRFEQQPTEIQNNNPVRQAIVVTIEGNNIPNSITDHDVVGPPTHMGAQPSLESISTLASSSFSSIEVIKLRFHNLIALPLEDLADPEKETSMKKALSILADNLSLFSEEQAEQILGLVLDFPVLVHNWRECHSQSQMYSQQSSKKIRDLVQTSVRDEESLKVRYEELGNKEKELMTQLGALQKEKAEIAEQRTEKSKQTKDLKAHRNKEERLMRIAATKLNDLSDQWAKLQSFFM